MLKICRRSAKDPATLRAKLWRAAGGVAPQSQSALAMLLRRALSVARQKSLAHSFPIYEIGLANRVFLGSAARVSLTFLL